MSVDAPDNRVPQGSSSKDFRLLFKKLTVARSHVCAYLHTSKPPPDMATWNGEPFTPQETWTMKDVPLTRWGDVAGFNVYATAYYIGKLGSGKPQAIRFIVGCSEGTSGMASDGECPLKGHVFLTISSKLRKKFGLKSATIFDHDFDLVDHGYGPLRMDWPVKRKVASKLAPDKRLSKITMTLKMRAPLDKRVSGRGNLFNYNTGLRVASWDRDGGGEDGER
jgi:hypothetical protein